VPEQIGRSGHRGSLSSGALAAVLVPPPDHRRLGF